MQIEVVKSKIHQVTVTGADLNYIGSITIDEALMEASNIIEGEKVQIVNISDLSDFKDGSTVDSIVLKKHGYIRSSLKPVKILGSGDASPLPKILKGFNEDLM